MQSMTTQGKINNIVVFVIYQVKTPPPFSEMYVFQIFFFMFSSYMLHMLSCQLPKKQHITGFYVCPTKSLFNTIPVKNNLQLLKYINVLERSLTKATFTVFY